MSLLHGAAGEAQKVGGGGGGQGVEDIVAAVETQLHVGIALPVDEDIKGGEVILVREVGGGAVGGFLQAEGEDRVGEALDGAVVPVTVSEEEWQAALEEPGVYFDFLSPLPLELISQIASWCYETENHP